MNLSLRQDRLEQMMLDEIRPAFDAFKYHVEVEQSQTDNSERIKSLRGKLKRLNELYVDGAIEKVDFDAKRADYMHQISVLSEQRINDTTEIETLLNQPWETLYNRLENPKDKAQFWRAMVGSIVWNGKTISIRFK